MSRKWIHEDSPAWDAPKAKIIGGAPDGIFDLGHYREGEVIPGEWWRVEEDGNVVGYGWMDCNFGDAEVLLAVDPGTRSQGLGTFIIDHLDCEAAGHGLRYMLNEVHADHPRREAVSEWLMRRGFERSHDDRLLRRKVREAAR